MATQSVQLTTAVLSQQLQAQVPPSFGNHCHCDAKLGMRTEQTTPESLVLIIITIIIIIYSISINILIILITVIKFVELHCNQRYKDAGVVTSCVRVTIQQRVFCVQQLDI